MNIKRLSLIAGLLSMVAAYANAAEITINVPVEITNGPLGKPVLVYCYVGIGSVPPERGNDKEDGFYAIPGSPSSKTLNYKGTLPVKLKPSAEVDRATHYRCVLVQIITVGGSRRPQLLEGNPSVTGAIAR
jgi:hypothetical protein